MWKNKKKTKVYFLFIYKYKNESNKIVIGFKKNKKLAKRTCYETLLF